MAKKKVFLAEAVRLLIRKLGQPPKIEWKRTGIHAFDLALGNGIPIGRILEIYGDESTGKSLLGWEIAKAFQKIGAVVVIFDTEATAPKKFMHRVGLNVDQVIYRKPETIEELEKEFFIILDALKKIDKDIMVLFLHDSVAATSSEGEWTYDAKLKRKMPKETEMGARARAMSRLMRHIARDVSKSRATYIAINQVRDKIGVMFGEKTTTPGGRALKFHASVRISLGRGGRIDAPGGVPVGVICNMFVKKNKCAEPFRKAPLKILWKQGFDRFGGLAEFLESQGKIEKVKNRYKYRNMRFRAKNIERVVRKHRELIKAIY